MQLFRNEARVKQLFSWYICRGQCVISSILSRHSKNLKRQTEQCCSSVLQLSFIWQAKENTSLRHVGGLTQQMQREEKPRLNIGSSFYVFLLPLSLPYVNWVARRAVCFTWGPHSGPQTFLCSIFTDFPFFLLATTILDSFFLF